MTTKKPKAYRVVPLPTIRAVEAFGHTFEWRGVNWKIGSTTKKAMRIRPEQKGVDLPDVSVGEVLTSGDVHLQVAKVSASAVLLVPVEEVRK